MPRSTTRRIIKKKKQLKKHIKRQVKSNQQNNQQKTQQLNPQIKPTLPLAAGFSHQQYGNPDLAIQQMRNQSQMTMDQINNYRATIESMKKEQLKNEKELKSMKKQAKEAKRNLESAQLDEEIAKDNLANDENIARKAAHLRERANKMELQNLEKNYDKDIIESHQKVAEYEDENQLLDMKIMQQRKTIELNNAAAKLKEKEEEYNIKLAENKAQFEYMKSKKFTSPEEELPVILTKIMKEEEMKSCFEARNNLTKEQKRLYEALENNPNDYESIQNQVIAENKERCKYIAELQRAHDKLNEKNEVIKHMQQKTIELKNKSNDLDIENAGLSERIDTADKKNTKRRAITASKKISQLELQNEGLKNEIEVNKELSEQEKQNKILKEKVEVFKNSSQNPVIQQQTEELVKVETDLAMKQKIGEQLDLTAKKLKQNREAEIANDTKIAVANQMYSGTYGDSSFAGGGDSGYGNDLDSVYQVNGQLDAKIENEQELSSHINDVQECDRLRQQIYEYKYNRDPEGTRWLELYKQSFPILEDGTNLTKISDPIRVAQIADRYAEKNNTGINIVNYNNNSGEGNNFYVEEEEDD